MLHVDELKTLRNRVQKTLPNPNMTFVKSHVIVLCVILPS